MLIIFITNFQTIKATNVQSNNSSSTHIGCLVCGRSLFYKLMAPPHGSAAKADFEILTVDNLQERMNKIATSLQATIEKPLPVCWALLQECKWSCDSAVLRYVNAGCKIPAKFCGAYNPKDPKESDPQQLYSSKGKSCILCDDEHVAVQGLNCAHLFCTECWDAYIRQKVVAENTCIIQCPDTNCAVLLDRFTLFRLCKDTNVHERYRQQEAQRYVMWNTKIKPCPGVGCTLYSLTQFWSDSARVACTCGNIYCSDCGYSWHEPINCALLAMWMRSISSDHKNLSWIHSNTKPCPKCKASLFLIFF
uniref:RBR-type E3 ubiquitin transferase n=2 Tax=Meloidogyne incognita TaxID=6306 RepID=A0A914LKS6_MELIC